MASGSQPEIRAAAGAPDPIIAPKSDSSRITPCDQIKYGGGRVSSAPLEKSTIIQTSIPTKRIGGIDRWIARDHRITHRNNQIAIPPSPTTTPRLTKNSNVLAGS